MFSTTPERTEIASRISELLNSAPIGTTITNESILDASGLPMSRTRPLLYSVMRALNKASGIVFGNVNGIGYQRLPTSSVPCIGQAARRTIARKSAGARKTIINALDRANDVESATRRRLHTEVGVLGLIELSADEKSFGRVAKALPTQALLRSAPSPSSISAALLASLSGKE